MEAQFAVELGAGDETLEMPWAAPDGGLRYYDLKRHPELLLNVEEAGRVRELGEFLREVNSAEGILETAKCDAWTSSEIDFEEEIFGAAIKFGGYIDLLFTEERARFSFPEHERLTKRLTDLLKQAPELPASAEFLVRRCYYHYEDQVARGFYITFYLFGYGEDETQARQQWATALKLVTNAIEQLSLR